MDRIIHTIGRRSNGGSILDGKIRAFEESSEARVPKSLLALLARERPVAHFSQRGFVLVSGYSAARMVLDDPIAFSSEPSGGMDPVLLAACPERHTGIRARVAAGLFSDTQSWRDHASQVAEETVIGFQPGAIIDAVSDFALPVAESATCRIMGLQPSMHAQIIAISEADRYGLAYLDDLRQAFAEHLGNADVQPDDGPVQRLLAEGNGMSEAEIASILALAWSAGTLTTAALIPLVLRNLIEELPGERAQWANAKIMNAAIEETLRRDTPLPDVWRVATQPCQIEGVEIEQGTLIKVSVAGAGHDPRKFADPTRFATDRGVQHIAFGHGAHKCLGAGMARTIARHALAALIDRFPEVGPVEGSNQTGFTAHEHFCALGSYPIHLGSARSCRDR